MVVFFPVLDFKLVPLK